MNDFINRYIKLWRYFHPDYKLNADFQKVAIQYTERLKNKKVSYQKFDEILTAIENEFSELPYGFNLVGYCLDWVKAEHQLKMREEAEFHKQPIKLAPEGATDLLINRPFIKSAIERNQGKGIDFIKLLSRAKYRKISLRHDLCYACDDQGYILFGGKYTEDSQTIEPYNNKKTYDFTIVKKCRCPKGIDKTKQCVLATISECQQAAQINGGNYQNNPPF